MVTADAARALLIGVIPLAFSARALNIVLLCGIAFSAGCFTVLFDSSFRSQLPRLYDDRDLLAANARIEVGNSLAEVFGSTAGGFVIGLIGAPLAMVVDVASFVLSGLFIARAPLALRARARRAQSVLADLHEGVAFVVRTRPLLCAALATTMSNFGRAVYVAVYVIFIYKALHLSPAQFGLAAGISNIGFVGALAAPTFERRLGRFGTLAAALLLAGAGQALLVLARAPYSFAVLVLSFAVMNFAIPTYNITLTTLRQRLTPHELLGRAGATVRTIGSLAYPLGALAGGALGAGIGLRPAIVAGSVIVSASILWLVPVFLDARVRQPAA